MLVFGAALRPLLTVKAAPWPAGSAAKAPLWRLCHGILHRRVEDVELHFLAADVIDVAGELQVELLWLATSDDRCVMSSASLHNDNEAYYSFLHTLPMSHLMAWRCAIAAEPFQDAVSTSLAGFAVTTSCRVPPGAAQVLRSGADSMLMCLWSTAFNDL